MASNYHDTLKLATPSNHNLVGYRIDQGRLEFISVLGLGAYGVVYLARDLTSADINNPNLYAVKVLNKLGLDARQKSFQRREITLHSLASLHPSIVTVHAVIESPSCIFVILDYCPDGDLFSMITEKKRYQGKTDAIKAVFIQIIEAVEFCHCLGISHRDLKPENILCKESGDAVVLADFGLATNEKMSSDFGCGSTFYMSPECQGGLFERLASYSTLHNDIWSLGVILVNLTCGRNPWKQAGPSDKTFRAYLANPDFLRSILPISESCNSLLKRIFCPNPSLRISLAELKAEILRIDTFSMSRDELSQATQATKEAACACRRNAPLSPKQPFPQPLARRYNALGVGELAHRKETEKMQLSQDHLTLPSDVNPLVAKPDFSLIKRFDRPTLAHLESPSAHSILPSGTMMSTFVSTSTSHLSSPSSNQQQKGNSAFSSRFLKPSNAASTLSKEGPHPPNNRRKLFAKPMSFSGLNAPRPIIVSRDPDITRDPAIISTSYIPSTPKTSTEKCAKQSKLHFSPFTPPSSASPRKATFGYIPKPRRFLQLSANLFQARPLVSPTHSHQPNLVLSLSP